MKRRARPWHASTNSLISKRLGRVDAARAPARVERGGERQRQRHQRDRQHVVPARVAAPQVDSSRDSMVVALQRPVDCGGAGLAAIARSWAGGPVTGPWALQRTSGAILESKAPV